VKHTPISVIILTKNEEEMIRRCIQSVGWADECVVVDSQSEDATCEIAKTCGATVYSQEWLGWSAQRNRGISLASYDWVFFVECDEIVTGDLARAIIALTESEMDPRDAYTLERRGDFLGILLYRDARRRRRQNFVRLFNRQHSEYNSDHLVHEEVMVPGTKIALPGILLHWRGYLMNEYIEVFNRYATLEAEQLDHNHKQSTWIDIFGRPVARFFLLYLGRRGYKLGSRGLIHALLKSSSDFIRYAKLWERQHLTGPVLHPSPDILAQFGGIIEHRASGLSGDAQDQT
jgi:(heptosyl)LPS beta-1,4-glucosyltransferase